MPSAHIPSLPSHNLKEIDGPYTALAVSSNWHWCNGTSLHVRFLNRNEKLEGLVQKAAKTWEKYANIKFIFDGAEEAEIRILFKEGLRGGSSLVGKPRDDEHQLFSEPTMYLGSLLSSDDEFRRTVLHEFGHALGCIHEHSSPTANIKWNKEIVIKWFKEEGYSEEWVEKNLFERYDNDSYQATFFDQHSIMIYPIKYGWAKNIPYIGYPQDLSDSDKMLIRRLYRPLMETAEVASFATGETRKGNEPSGRNVKRVELKNAQKREPDFSIGLTQFDLCCQQGMHLQAYQDSVESTAFNLHLDSRDGTIQNSAAAHCMVSEKDTMTIQTGSYTTNKTDMVDEEGNEYKVHVKFEQPFEKPPGVIVWIQGFDFALGSGFGICADAENVALDGFALSIENLGDAELNAAQISWIAYEKDPPGIESGRVEFPQFKGNKGDALGRRVRNKKLEVGQWQLTAVHAGISKFNFQTANNIALALNIQQEKHGFEISVATWHNTVCNGVAVSYLAVSV
jgi:hypothetical protein